MLFQGRHRVRTGGFTGQMEVGLFFKIGMMVVIPTMVALFGGAWLAMRTLQVRNQRVDAQQLQEVTSQARSLTDRVMGEIEQVRVEARAIQKVHHLQVLEPALATSAALQGALAPFFSEIFYWAEFDYDAAGVKNILHSMKKPAWQEGQASAGATSSAYSAQIDDRYLLGALKNLDLDSLRKSGMAILRFKQEPSRANEWLALVFDEISGGGKAIFALVDPVTAFPSFEQLARRSEGGMLRAYLIGSDGYILSHSKAAYTAADFSRTPLFRDALRFLFTRDRVSGAGTFRAIDEVPVVASYQQPGGLPLGVVVEKIKSGVRPEFSSISWEAVVGWSGLWVLAWVWAIWMIERTLLAMRPKTAPRGREFEEGPSVDALIRSAEGMDTAQKAERLARQKISDAVGRGDLALPQAPLKEGRGQNAGKNQEEFFERMERS